MNIINGLGENLPRIYKLKIREINKMYETSLGQFVNEPNKAT